MGCDGGTIPRRDELVRTKKKPEQVDKDAENAAKWKHCALSQQELVPPIVACELGSIYNKEAILTYLLDKSMGNEKVSHIRSLKDVKTLNLTENITYLQRNGADKGDEYVDRQAARFICPIVGLEMNGKYKFCYLQGCGCVVSLKGVKEVKLVNCHKCGKPHTAGDVVILNGSVEEVEELRVKMNERRAAAKLEKAKAKEAKESKRKLVANGTSEKTSEEEKSKKQKVDFQVPSTSNGTGVANGKKSKPMDKTKPEYSIADDPNATEAFKSLFTSHETCKNQPKPHWITHNPCFY